MSVWEQACIYNYAFTGAYLDGDLTQELIFSLKTLNKQHWSWKEFIHTDFLFCKWEATGELRVAGCTCPGAGGGALPDRTSSGLYALNLFLPGTPLEKPVPFQICTAVVMNLMSFASENAAIL